MICPKCRSDNEMGARFCAGCGAAIEVTRQGQCPYCGESNSPDSLFCDSCGNRIVQQVHPGTQAVSSNSHQVAPPPAGKSSAAWWLMPILLGWVGGLVAFLVVKDKEKSKAIKLLLTGIALSVLWVAFGIVIMILTSLDVID